MSKTQEAQWVEMNSMGGPLFSEVEMAVMRNGTVLRYVRDKNGRHIGFWMYPAPVSPEEIG